MAVDVNVTVGPWPTDDHPAWAPADVLAHLDRHGLDAALVRHSLAVRYDPVAGNRALREALAGDERLLPAYVLGPLDCGEFGPPEDLPARLAAEGVRAVWLYPRSHTWSPDGPEAAGLVEALRAARLPVFVEQDEMSWSEVDRLAEAAPELDIVVCGVGYRTLRQLIAVLDRRPRVHVDLSYLASQDGLELLAGRYGTGRVLLGTGAPIRDDAAPVFLLARAALAQPGRAAVAGANARRILPSGAVPVPVAVGGAGAGAGPVSDTFPQVDDVLDAHAHIGAWPGTWLPQQEADELVAAMDRAGTRQTVVSHLLGIWADPIAGNEQAVAAAQRHPGRVYVYLVADPHRPQDESVLARQLELPGVVGIKVHPHTHECAMDDRRYDWIWRLAQRHDVAVLGHGFADTWHSDPRLFGNVAARHPELRLLIGHSGATVTGFRRTIEVCRAHPNVYAETCGSWMTGRWLRRMVDALGADRIVHGTDACVIDQRYGLGRVLGADLTGRERALILASNARRLLNIPCSTGGD
ncbi:amidohydrolase family protein [Dactylosporangium fulvum]|uniref:Amidohydrolase family protein n=1 Tax=Dactylosporangium fulvum TaxID=53359 RepID=A0ABY5W5P9_9ACTN|nr:amidohydrolase family protein [Dactylosporangium fulvum]UWP85300.1 amidohydrolase family protein [Dactylosporangium fulvum]